jgi:putative ABC transport system substrate-binding protein
VAARGARAAASDTGDRVPQRRIARGIRVSFGRVPPRPEGGRLRRGSERDNRVRWAEGQYDRLPSLAADLVQHKVTVIAATSTPAALAAKAATSTVPIVFTTGGDPIKLGLVASLNRPGGNVTGSTQLSVEVGPKRLELARELFPGATTVALLVNPANPLTATVSKDLQAVADTLDVRLHVLHASTEADFEAAFAMAAQLRAAALVISGADPVFGSHAAQLGALALRHSVPAIYQFREFAAAGGLMSYGGYTTDTYRLGSVYTGRILKGEKPADLPVVQRPPGRSASPSRCRSPAAPTR